MPSSALQALIPDARPALSAILDAGRGPLLPPIRSEIFGPQRFAQHGRSLGETHRAERGTWRGATFFPRLRSNIRTLREAHGYIAAQATTGYDISPAAEWLLDNFHLIEAQLTEIHERLPRSYFRSLPVLQDEPLAGLPRVYGVAWAFVAHTDGAFDDNLLAHFLCAYQETRELELSEIWALPTTLRVVLVENLRRLAERVATNKAARELANLCFDRLESYPLHVLDQVLALLTQRGVGTMFLGQMSQRMQDLRTTAHAQVHQPYDDWLRRALPDRAAAQTQHSADQAADNLSVSNALRSLRAIADADWPDIVARTSALMQAMLGSRIFEAEHAATRDRTLHAIEHLARRQGHSELEVARTLLGLMQAAEAQEGQPVVASRWLQGEARPALLRALGPGRATGLAARMVNLPWPALARRAALPAYLGTLLLGTLGVVAWLLARHHADTGGADPAWLLVLGVALMLFPASEAVVAVINRLISESARPQHLPRLALTAGIPAEHRVMVVIPALLTDPDSTRELVHRLLLHHLANPERHTQFALLSDWADADTERCHGDEALLADARAQIRALNASHGDTATLEAPADPAPPRFLLLHRERRYSHTERRWIGEERKRGKLELLVETLATGSPAGFLDLGDDSRIAAGTAYVVTLDSDTQLPPGRLRELVGVAAHPDNQPLLDAEGRCVVRGYGILQPRIVTPLPAPQEHTAYHALFAGQCGIDPYSAATSEVYQDVFGEGTFTGKGLLNVGAMHAVLSGRLPEGQVLSHDLLEGSIARCAAVTDITLIEDAPFHADVAASRVHRWTRGDWQLLPFLLDGLRRTQRYPLRGINRWKMLDNLRRSLVAPMSLGLLLLSLAGAVVSPWAAVGLVIAAFSAGPLMGAVAGLSPSRDDVAARHFYLRAGAELGRVLGAGLWLFEQLLELALKAGDAIVRALYRTFVSRRHLLQWTTAAAAQARASTDLLVLLRRHALTPVVALGLLAALWFAGAPHPLAAVLLCLSWATAPIGIWWVSRPRARQGDTVLGDEARQYLQGVARDTWRLFERCVVAEDHYLPPDNLQTAPHDMVAHRTSPTNIGLYLLCVACARRFGWIGTAELATRLEATLATLHRMQRHRGHFLNWYDTRSLAPLLPMYVSTVDSGNLSGHLLAVAQACRELAVARNTRDESALPARLEAIAQDCEALAWAPDLGFLYHRKRHLFHIGFRVAEQELDAGFYDLLASEARLTSLLAIAKGDVPVTHWASLGRMVFAVGSEAGLRSWSGSMFEYLMPSLVLAEPHGSLLQAACHAAVREQMAYAKARGGVPWGISESAYAASDHTLAYQYAPQGVPRLALRRTPPDELVIAPYATLLAAQVDPAAACLNLRTLEAMGARGAYGFIEALDFTAARQAGGGAFTPVHTFMAHHQGMAIVALANVLLDGAARRWGMGNAHIEAVASLLHERMPREVSRFDAIASGAPPQAVPKAAPRLLREVLPGTAALEPTHMLSNGRYSVTLRANGAGSSRWGRSGITRWRDDALRDAHGSFFYLRWDRQPQPVSITQHPAPDPRAQYGSVFHADRVCFDAAWPALQAHTTVWVSPEDDIEFRQVEVRNHSDRPLDIELLSAFEPTLAEARADESHPAFSNLFLRAEWQEQHQALVFERKPRLITERGLQAAHFIAESDPQVVGIRCQSDRERWLGRNHPASQPRAAFDVLPAERGAALDTGLDPVCALAVQLRLPPRAVAKLTFATAASDDAGTLAAMLDKYRQPSHVQRASLMSATLAGIRLRELRISAENYGAIQTLTTALVLSLTRPPSHAPGDVAAAADACDRRLLWRFGISGDRPLILVSAGVKQGLGLLRSLAQALRLWSWGGVECDLVVVNAEPASYLAALQHEVSALREQHGTGRHDGTGFHLLRADELSDDELGTLRSLARIRLQADGRPLLHHVQEWAEQHDQAMAERSDTSTTPVDVALAASEPVAVPAGGFRAPSGEFGFEVGALQRPARPWINVLANPGFGAQLSEAGGGYTWARNSRLNQLTGWSNDPVADPPSEWFLLQDRRTRQAWSLTPSAWGAIDDGDTNPRSLYQVRHGQGYSQIRHCRGDLEVTATWCVDARTAVKQVHIRLVNRGTRSLALRLVGIAEWTMGAQRADRGTVQTALHRQRLPALPPGTSNGAPQERKLTALLATQHERSAGFGAGTAFLALAGAADEREDWSCDRRECFDARGAFVLPDHFGQRSGGGLDPCAALATRVTVPAGDTAERVFLLGYGDSPDEARRVATVAATVPAARRLEEVRESWDELLGATKVQTPDPQFDAMVNHWLLYQTVVCRLWAKAGFYQAGGATGFRDQLQDAMSLAWAAPGMLREQILLCASRQFAAGDVQHWWHAPTGAGVRTHFSDDLLWLPFACAHYLRATGDARLLDEAVPFLEGAAIPEGAEDVYDTPRTSTDQATVYEHAARAIERSLRVGAHGVPLMGTGDWNDGMNRVGHEGRGESVWLGWFLCRLVDDFLPWARQRGDEARVQRWSTAVQGWKQALNASAWDGQWFKRAWFDGGQPLGSHVNSEARIDLIAQAWAVLSHGAPPALQRMAMASVEAHLVDHSAGLIRLLDPPLAHAEPSAGYIQAYPPGVRENGGQYSHAGVWALMAQAQAQTDPALRVGATREAADTPYRYFCYLSPAHRAQHPLRGPAYGIEPYVMAGDVYSQPPYVGRGGWSWYTGSAAWMHRAAIESIFGLKLEAEALQFTPCLPSAWPQAELTLRRGARSMRFVFVRATPDEALEATATTRAGTVARLLHPGERLAWPGLPPQSCFVVPLPPAQARARGTTDGATAQA